MNRKSSKEECVALAAHHVVSTLMRSGRVWIRTDARHPIDRAVPLPAVVELEDEVENEEREQTQDKEQEDDETFRGR